MSSPMINAHELLEGVHRSDVKIFDVRGAWSDSTEVARRHYLNAHFDGTSFLDWKTSFLATGYPHHSTMALLPSEGRTPSARLQVNGLF